MPALLSADAMPDEEHNSDEVLRNAEGGEENYDAFEIPAAETYAHLPKPIRDNIAFCIQAMGTSHSEWQDTIDAINTAFDAQKISLDEQHARAKAQEVAFEKREALYIRLPTNQAVNLVHNALLTEHAHERVLVTDMFRAVKIGKVDMRVARADGLTKVKEVYLAQRKTLNKLIEGLSGMAGNMKNERVVAGRGTRATGVSAAVRSPAPASYPQVTALARPGPLPRLLPLTNITADSIPTTISAGWAKHLKSIIETAILRCEAAEKRSSRKLRVEYHRTVLEWRADRKAFDKIRKLENLHRADYRARKGLITKLMDDSDTPSIFNDLVNGMNKEVSLFETYKAIRITEEARSLCTSRMRAKVAEDLREEQRVIFDNQLHSLRCIAAIARIDMSTEMSGGFHCKREVGIDISRLRFEVPPGVADYTDWFKCLQVKRFNFEHV